MYAIPKTDALYDIGPKADEPRRPLTSDERRDMVDRHEQFVEEMTKATVAGLTGEVTWGSYIDPERPTAYPVMGIKRDPSRAAKTAEVLGEVEMAKGVYDAPWEGSRAERLSKEWSLTNPVPSGLVPYDLEAPAKLLTPRPTPIRNETARIKGQGGARRFKVISGFTGTGTGGITTTQPGINETSTNAGPGGLSYVRGPYINYAGYDQSVNYVTTSLSDSVSWQAEFQGQGFEDVRSLSNTALLYSTMLLDERLMLYGRGTTGNGYVGALGTPSNVTVAAVSASIAPGGTSTLGSSATVFVLVAADAGDLLGTTGTTMHQGPTSTINSSASVSTSAGLTAVQVTIGTDVPGALGYNIYTASVVGGPYYYSGRTASNIGYVVAQPSSGPTTTSGAGDQSAVANNYDGLLSNVAASGGYVTRLNAPFSTTSPATEFQTAFGQLYEQTKSDPEVVWLNGFDRLQLSNALTNNATNSAYRVFINQNEMGQVKAGTVLTTLMNEVTGSEVALRVHPWLPAGNALIRQVTLPIPDSNVSETSVMCLPQDYVAVQWPVVQFTYDASTFEIGSFLHYAPAWSGLIQGIQSVGAPVKPPSFGDA